jgi:hypothetical protein
MSTRGAHLVEGDRSFTTGGGLLGRLVAPAFAAVVDSIDKRLETGGIDATLPGGERRKLGFRAPCVRGPGCVRARQNQRDLPGGFFPGQSSSKRLCARDDLRSKGFVDMKSPHCRDPVRGVAPATEDSRTAQ